MIEEEAKIPTNPKLFKTRNEERRELEV